jgi:hypothetical protein
MIYTTKNHYTSNEGSIPLARSIKYQALTTKCK